MIGILLAAGRGERFGGDKLLAQAGPGPGFRDTGMRGGAGERVGVVACRNLLLAVSRVVAVVRPGDAALAAALGAAGARVVRCPNADEGMGASLACGVTATKDAAGWIVALADMPWVLPSTIARVAGAVAGGAPVAAPFYRGRRGHPVGFSATCYAMLAALHGDDGAKAFVAAYGEELARIDVEDAGTQSDIDRPADLQWGSPP